MLIGWSRLTKKRFVRILNNVEIKYKILNLRIIVIQILGYLKRYDYNCTN